MRVVLDTNIIISFLLTKGATIFSIFEAWERSQFILLVSEEIVLEIRQVLQRFVTKKLISQSEGEALLRRIKKDAELIITTSQTELSKDKKDNKLLVCTEDGKADYLVTGDKRHLIPLKKLGSAKIISPKKFVHELK